MDEHGPPSEGVNQIVPAGTCSSGISVWQTDQKFGKNISIPITWTDNKGASISPILSKIYSVLTPSSQWYTNIRTSIIAFQLPILLHTTTSTYQPCQLQHLIQVINHHQTSHHSSHLLLQALPVASLK